MRAIRSAVITGPTGAIGRALCERLAEEGLAVYAVCRPGSHRSDDIRETGRVRKVFCDVSDLPSLPGMIEGADAFFHLAWMSPGNTGRNDMDTHIRNIRYTLDAVRTAKELGCSVFVGAGSQAEYGRVDHALTADTPCFPENGYGIAKLCAGQMSRVECGKLGIDHIWPRILSVYGPHDNRISMIPSVTRTLLKGEVPALTAGEQLWDLLYADDAAEALYRLALNGKPDGIYPVGSGASRPLREYIELLRDAVDPSLPLGFGETAYEEKQVMHLQADISALERDTGFVPRVDFHTGIRKTIDWVRSDARQENDLRGDSLL